MRSTRTSPDLAADRYESPRGDRGPATALLLAGLGAVLFSAKAIVVKLCYRHGADTETVLALRMLLSMPFFWAAAWWYTARHRPVPLRRKELLAMLALGFVGYFLSSYLDFLGLQYVSAGLERIILYLNPSIVLVASAVLLKKQVDSRQWLAMGVAYAGVVLVFLHDVRLDGGNAALGSALVFTGALTYAIYLVFAGEIVNSVGSIRLVAWASTSSTLCCLALSLASNAHGLVSQVPEVYALSLLNAGLCTFVPMLLIMMAVNRVGSGLAAQAGIAGPVATVFLGWYFLGEALGWLQVLGIAVVLASMAMLMTTARKAPPAGTRLVARLERAP